MLISANWGGGEVRVIGNFMANVSMRYFSYAAAVSMICIYGMQFTICKQRQINFPHCVNTFPHFSRNLQRFSRTLNANNLCGRKLCGMQQQQEQVETIIIRSLH